MAPGQRPRSGVVEGGDAIDTHVAITVHFSADTDREIGQAWQGIRTGRGSMNTRGQHILLWTAPPAMAL